MRTLALLSLLLVSCSDSSEPPRKGGSGGHHHESPRGGTLVQVGAYYARPDPVLDPQPGELHAYVMDGHATKAVRIPQKMLAATLTVDGEDLTLALEAVEDGLSGETVGDTSHFRAVSEALKGKERFSGRIGPIRVYGKDFDAIACAYGPSRP